MRQCYFLLTATCILIVEFNIPVSDTATWQSRSRIWYSQILSASLSSCESSSTGSRSSSTVSSAQLISRIMFRSENFPSANPPLETWGCIDWASVTSPVESWAGWPPWWWTEAMSSHRPESVLPWEMPSWRTRRGLVGFEVTGLSGVTGVTGGTSSPS